MGIFSLQPTFTQGFFLGQLSVLVLLAVVLKYLFLDTEPSQKAAERASPVSQPTRPFTQTDENPKDIESESTEWLNALLHQVCRRCQPATARPYVDTVNAISGHRHLSLKAEG